MTATSDTAGPMGTSPGEERMPYGLSGAVTSADPERALGVARRVRSGTIGVDGGVFYGADAPFGGYKASGVGRQNGIEGFEQHLETKTIAIGR